MTEAEAKAKLVRKASRAIVGGFRPSDNPFSSWFGRVRVSLPDETWPVWDGKPMMPLCQFNLEEVPYLPENMADIALITVFMQRDDLPSFNPPNGNQWLLRAYPALKGLVAIEEPSDQGDIKPFPVHWELIEEDYPTWDDAWSMDLPVKIKEKYHDIFETQQGTKIGGWPFNAQSEIFWAPENQHPANPEYVFQIDSEAKAHWTWGDSGFGYFGRGTGAHRNQWALEWQCY